MSYFKFKRIANDILFITYINTNERFIKRLIIINRIFIPLVFIGFVCLLLTGCNTESVVNSSLSGVWIETTHKTDTLAFNNQFQGFILNREREVRYGYLLPKGHSGPYTYELKNDSITLLWSASDYNKGTNYYFKPDLKNNQLKIGNFYVDSIENNEVLTFSKIQD